MNKVSTIATGLRFPEGPAFTSDGTLWCVESEGESLFYLKPTGESGRIHVGANSRPNGICVDSLDRIWFCDSGWNAIRCFNPGVDLTAPQEAEVIIDRVDGEPLNMPNDLIMDTAGNLLFTCPGPSGEETTPTGYVCVCTPLGVVRKIAENLFYPNGLCLLPDGHTLLIAETNSKRIWYGYWNPNAEDLDWEHPDVWTSTGPDGFGPDGMTLGADGNLYVAVFGSGTIKVYNQQGQHLHDIQIPGENPTNIACDPTKRLGLVATEAERGELISIQY
ncbi:SMP-30/gluconolactonase/LRE family protein [Tellurirhabdus bombi]|uniref:SMP-30/gluconolactonase/LRE family protein n=1 Tax=Tellurirhabdus bombi TaxID=2907205 RepID=UPI001F2A815C|nr:SMP-30/gluconolactonase/LRE family protein [Tellurirhabdus bombi]